MTKLCPRGKAAAKRKFDVYPSAYANAYASKICAGKIKIRPVKKEKTSKVQSQQVQNQAVLLISEESCLLCQKVLTK